MDQDSLILIELKAVRAEVEVIRQTVQNLMSSEAEVRAVTVDLLQRLALKAGLLPSGGTIEPPPT